MDESNNDVKRVQAMRQSENPEGQETFEPSDDLLSRDTVPKSMFRTESEGYMFRPRAPVASLSQFYYRVSQRMRFRSSRSGNTQNQNANQHFDQNQQANARQTRLKGSKPRVLSEVDV